MGSSTLKKEDSTKRERGVRVDRAPVFLHEIDGRCPDPLHRAHDGVTNPVVASTDVRVGRDVLEVSLCDYNPT